MTLSFISLSFTKKRLAWQLTLQTEHFPWDWQKRLKL
jgi:hypothetical protein